MKILLLGDYSSVHWTLAEGLRQLGHEAVVVSDGDYWKGYRRDINLQRRSTGLVDSLRYISDVVRLWPKLKGFDVVQIINPMFLELRAERIMPFYRYLRRNNARMVMGAFGMDHYWVKTCLDCKTFRYSDFNIGSRSRADEPYNKEYIDQWLNGAKGKLNQQIATDCDAIVSGLYEYDVVYKQWFPEKTTFIPMPIRQHVDKAAETGECVRFFIGIQQGRSDYKGTDVMLRALERVHAKYPDRCKVVKVESMPFDQYIETMRNCDVLLDQLYSYTPAMNALHAMSMGLVVVGGGEEENYEILGEKKLRPIINVLPDEDDVYQKLEHLVLHPELLPDLKRQSIEYVRRHHDYINVAQKYIDTWQNIKTSTDFT